MSAAYAVDSTDQNSSDTADQGATDSGVSDGSTDPGLSDDPSSDAADNGTGTDEDPYILASADEPILYKDVSAENNNIQFDPDQVRSSVQFDPDQVKNDAIPMQKTGAPILPAVAGIITIMGGFLVNRFKS